MLPISRICSEENQINRTLIRSEEIQRLDTSQIFFVNVQRNWVQMLAISSNCSQICSEQINYSQICSTEIQGLDMVKFFSLTQQVDWVKMKCYRLVK